MCKVSHSSLDRRIHVDVLAFNGESWLCPYPARMSSYDMPIRDADAKFRGRVPIRSAYGVGPLVASLYSATVASQCSTSRNAGDTVLCSHPRPCNYEPPSGLHLDEMPKSCDEATPRLPIQLRSLSSLPMDPPILHQLSLRSGWQIPAYLEQQSSIGKAYP